MTAEIMSIWSWNLNDFDRIDDLDELIQWRNRAVSMHNKINGSKE